MLRFAAWHASGCDGRAWRYPERVVTHSRPLAQALGDCFDARVATSGVSAIALALESPPDVILLEVIMPAMDGCEVLRWLKSESRTRNTPVIFVTSLDEAGDEAHGLELGAVDYVVKLIGRKTGLVASVRAGRLKLMRMAGSSRTP